jgi:hypothetical protein
MLRLATGRADAPAGRRQRRLRFDRRGPPGFLAQVPCGNDGAFMEPKGRAGLRYPAHPVLRPSARITVSSVSSSRGCAEAVEAGIGLGGSSKAERVRHLIDRKSGQEMDVDRLSRSRGYLIECPGRSGKHDCAAPRRAETQLCRQNLHILSRTTDKQGFRLFRWRSARDHDL